MLIESSLAATPNLDDLYRLHAPRVFALACWLLPTHDAAADALSEIFLRLPAALASYDGRVPFEAWLLRVTANWCIDCLRRRTRERRLFEPADTAAEPADAGDSPLDELLLRERRDALRDAVRQLPPRYRVPLVLRYYCDLTYEEIAARIGLDRPQTGVLLFRAKRELRRILEGKPL
jgi:RNA polymerase sigma-70 factor (ECF subfamily)